MKKVILWSIIIVFSPYAFLLACRLLYDSMYWFVGTVIISQSDHELQGFLSTSFVGFVILAFILLTWIRHDEKEW